MYCCKVPVTVLQGLSALRRASAEGITHGIVVKFWKLHAKCGYAVKCVIALPLFHIQGSAALYGQATVNVQESACMFKLPTCQVMSMADLSLFHIQVCRTHCLA